MKNDGVSWVEPNQWAGEDFERVQVIANHCFGRDLLALHGFRAPWAPQELQYRTAAPLPMTNRLCNKERWPRPTALI